MIFDNPINWQDLQNKVCIILNQIGFEASTSKIIKTPRGQIEVDVFAIDPFSIDKIVYIVECKNWKYKVPQTITHSFNTVMQETGANVGYIISKEGFQKGAFDFTQNTSIKNLTFNQFQKKYLKAWSDKYFNNELKKTSNSLFQYTEPINSRRERYIYSLSQTEKKEFNSLIKKHSPFAALLLLKGLGSSKVFSTKIKLLNELEELIEIEEFKNILRKYSGIAYSSTCYSDLLKELNVEISKITNEFNELFGKDIFSDNY